MYLKTNYHTHTERCGHANGTEREYIENAIKSGITELGFSDHSPYVFDGDYYSGHRIRHERIADYFEVLTKLKDEYKAQIKIHIGFEAEYYPKFFDKFLDLVKDYPLEYLILGQHFLDNEQDTHLWCVKPYDDNATLTKFVNQVIEAMETGKFSYIAHPDVLNFAGDADFYKSEMTRLCIRAKELSLPLEYNLLGLQGNRHYPSERFFKIAADIGNEVIIGIDAHSPEVIGDFDVYNTAKENLDKLNIKPIETLKLIKP